MGVLISDDIIEKLIPVLSEKDKEEIRAYYSVQEKYADEVNQRARDDLQDHPVFGKLIRDIPADVAAAQTELTKQLQHDAIYNDNWHPHIQYQVQQGILYAQMGLDFRTWYEMIGLARMYLMPYFQREYGNGDLFLAALNGLNTFMDIGMAVLGEAYIQEKNQVLEQKVAERTAQLESVNKELEAFTYSVSHDLRAPLRAVNGYAEMLIEDYGSLLDDEGKRIVTTISANAAKMGILIDDLLAFSQLGRKEVQKTTIHMNELVAGVMLELQEATHHQAHIEVGNLHAVHADYSLIHQVMYNLLSNAIKYSSKKDRPHVEIASETRNGEIIFSVKDNGSGFDMRFVGKLFGVFQRLHSQDEFEGTGVGLAIVHRIIARHGGNVWAEGRVDAGATFYFSLLPT